MKSPRKAPENWTFLSLAFHGRLILYSGGTDSFETFTAELSASAPVVYKNPSSLGPEILYTTGAGKGFKVSVAIFASSGGGV